MSNLPELLAQKQALDAQIAQAQAAGRAEGLAQVRKVMADHGLTPADLGASSKRNLAANLGKVPAKYRDHHGNTWSGRGLQPVWLRSAIASGAAGLDDFKV